MKRKRLLRSRVGVRLERIQPGSRRREAWYRLTGDGTDKPRRYDDKAAAKRAFAWSVACRLAARGRPSAWLVVG